MKRIVSYVVLIALVASFFGGCKSTSYCSYIENYYPSIYQAELEFYKGRYQKANELFAKASVNCDLRNQRGIYEIRKYAESCIKIGDTIKAIELFEKLLRKGSTLEELKNNEITSSLSKHPLWINLEGKSNTIREEYLASVNLSLRSQLRDMIYDDQRHRRKLRTASNKDSLWILINRVDSINELKLKKIVERYGYPNEEIIGVYNIDTSHVNPITLLFHFDDFDFWTEELLKAIDNGSAPPKSLGTFVDSYQRRKPERDKFIYGIYDNATDKEIKDYRNLDKRRESIGLPPIAIEKKIDSFKRALYRY